MIGHEMCDPKESAYENEKCIETLSSSFTSALHYQSIFWYARAEWQNKKPHLNGPWNISFFFIPQKPGFTVKKKRDRGK